MITAGGRQFYATTCLIRDANSVKTLIGKSFTIAFNTNDHSVNMKYKGTDYLRSLVVDLDFIITYIENGSFSYNGIEIPFDNSEADFSNFDIKEEKSRLDYLKKIIQVLDCLGCRKDINLKKLTQQDWKNIDYLIQAFVEKEPVKGLKEDLSPLVFLKVGELRFALCFEKLEDEPGTYHIYDFFKTELSLVYDNNVGEKLPISQYVILNSDDFLTVDNIRFDVFLPSFQKIERHSELMGRANLFMLEVIKAFDKDPSKKELLNVAADFAEWLMNSSEDELPYYVRYLNKIQIEKRYGNLSIERVKELFQIVETPNIREEILVGAYLLLDQPTAAELHYERMDPLLQKEFKEYPIYHFWKGKTDSD